jgi:hypothetical protein
VVEGLERAHHVDLHRPAQLCPRLLGQERRQGLQHPLRQMPLRLAHQRASRGRVVERRQDAEGPEDRPPGRFQRLEGHGLL